MEEKINVAVKAVTPNGCRIEADRDKIMLNYSKIRTDESLTPLRMALISQDILRDALARECEAIWDKVSQLAHNNDTEPLRGDELRAQLYGRLAGGDKSIVDTMDSKEVEFVLFLLGLSGLEEVVLRNYKGYNEFMAFFGKLGYDKSIELTGECLDFFDRKEMVRPAYILLTRKSINEDALLPAARFLPRGA